MNDSLVSIVIPNYNRANLIGETLDSIIQQTYRNWECIIVDDCSTDDSLQLIEGITKGDPRIKIFLNNNNQGVGFTKKRCIELATGDICAFVDPDDAITSDALEIMTKAHIENPETSLVYSNYIKCDESLLEKSIHKNIAVESFRMDFYNLENEISHFATFKKKNYNKSSGLNPSYKRVDDQDLYLTLYETGAVHYINHNLYKYRIHSEGISTFDNIDKAYYWQWHVVIDHANKRGENVENLFFNYLERRSKYLQLERKLELLKKSKWLKLGAKLGVLKNFKYL